MHRRISDTILLLLATVSAAIAAPQSASIAPAQRDLSAYEGRPRVQALRLNADETILMDGLLNELIWERAIPATDFIQQDPDLGQPATERTEVRFAFSRTALYMGVTCYDAEPDNLKGNNMSRDGSLAADDRFMWAFDPFLDGRSGYSFEMNPSGAMADSLLVQSFSAAGGAIRNWDGIWYAKVHKSDIGWTIEIEIPFRTLNFDPNAPAWGANFQRTVRRKNEESLWTGWLRNQRLIQMSNAGLLEGISDVSQGVGLDIQPYTTGSYIDAKGRGLGSNFEGDGGVDFNYNITPQLKGNLTINTDFAETEVDQRRVNLTRFPLFFPERRGFFLDGATFFEFARELPTSNAIRPFFSRQIGLDANGQPQRIDYGAKLTGQIGPYDLGLIQMRTARSDRLIGEDFTVLRAKRRLFLVSYAGLLYTRRAGRHANAPDRHTLGIDFSLGTTRLRGSQNLELSGYYLWTTQTGSEKDTAAFGFRVDYPNSFWDAQVSVREIQRGYDPAVGFVNRRGVRTYNPILMITPRPQDSRVRNYLFGAGLELLTDTENQLLTRSLNLRLFRVNFQSGDTFLFNITPTFERLERDFEISQGVLLPHGSTYNFTRYTVQAATATRRVVSVTTRYQNGTFYSGHRRDFVINIGLRPRAGVRVNLNNEWSRVELPEGNFSTSVLRLVADNQFGPWISVANNVQYDSVTRILGWQSRFRWIVRPGNNIYFVYIHNWIDELARGRSTLDRSAAAKIIYTHSF